MSLSSSILIPIIVPIVIGLMMAVRRSKSKLVGGRKELTYPIAQQAFAAIGGAVLLTGIIVCAYLFWHGLPGSASDPAAYGVVAIMAALVLVCGQLPREVFLRRMYYDAAGIHQWSLEKGSRSIAWQDVLEYYDPAPSTPYVSARDGTKIKISKFRNGFPELLGELKRRAVPGAEDAQDT